MDVSAALRFSLSLAKGFEQTQNSSKHMSLSQEVKKKTKPPRRKKTS